MQTILEIEKKLFKEKSLNLAFFSLLNGDSCAKKGRKSICKDNHYRIINSTRKNLVTTGRVPFRFHFESVFLFTDNG